MIILYLPRLPRTFFLMAIIAAFGFKINFENCIYFKCGAAKWVAHASDFRFFHGFHTKENPGMWWGGEGCPDNQEETKRTLNISTSLPPSLCCKQPPPQAPPTAASRFHHRSKQSWWNTHNSHTESCAFHAHSHIWFGAGKGPPQWWHLMMLEAIVGDASEARQGNILIYIYTYEYIPIFSIR